MHHRGREAYAEAAAISLIMLLAMLKIAVCKFPHHLTREMGATPTKSTILNPNRFRVDCSCCFIGSQSSDRRSYD